MACADHLTRNLEDAGRDLQLAIASLRRTAEAEELRVLGERLEISGAQVRAIIASRRLRRDSLDLHGGDPGWALLLELFAQRLEGSRTTLTGLRKATGLPPSTAQRWIARLEQRGLVARRAHPRDERLVLFTLTDEAEDRLRAYLLAALRLTPWVM